MRSRILWITLAVPLLAAVAACLGISAWMNNYLRSSDFRKLIETKTGEAFHGEATYGPLHWAGSSVFSDSLGVEGEPGSIVHSIQADQIRAEVNWRAAFTGAWRVDRIEVVNLDATFQPGSQAAPPEHRTPPAPQSWLRSLLPSRFELGELQIAKGRLSFLGPSGGNAILVDGPAITVRPSGSGWTVDGMRGDLTVPQLPKMDITSFRSRIQNGSFFLTDGQLRLGESGKVQASGEFADTSKLQAQWDHVDISQFLPPEWQSRLSGLTVGTTEASWPATGLQDGKITGTFRLSDGLIQNLATLEKIATFTGAPQFRRMPVQQFSTDYRWEKGDLTLTNLIVESRGLLRVEGTCAVAKNGGIDGSFRVGVTPQTLQWLPGSRERVFTIAENGYLWTNVRVGGTLQSMKEDLSPRLANAMKNEVIEQGTRALEVLPDAAKKGAKGVLDALTPLLQ